jgi:hypothetical protein
MEVPNHFFPAMIFTFNFELRITFYHVSVVSLWVPSL